jgi:hypothetical protein
LGGKKYVLLTLYRRGYEVNDILRVLQEEFLTTLSLTETSAPRLYRFPEAKNLIKIAIGKVLDSDLFIFYSLLHFRIEGATHKGKC